jgi:hypothetical protein
MSDCPQEEFDRRRIKSITSFDRDGSVEYTITFKDGKLSVDNQKYQAMLAKQEVRYKYKVYTIDSPQEWLHGLMYDTGSYTHTEFEFED